MSPRPARPATAHHSGTEMRTRIAKLILSTEIKAITQAHIQKVNFGKSNSYMALRRRKNDGLMRNVGLIFYLNVGAPRQMSK